MVKDSTAPELFSIWLDGDILGVGDCLLDAVAEAEEMVEFWENRSPRLPPLTFG